MKKIESHKKSSTSLYLSLSIYLSIYLYLSFFNTPRSYSHTETALHVKVAMDEEKKIETNSASTTLAVCIKNEPVPTQILRLKDQLTSLSLTHYTYPELWRLGGLDRLDNVLINAMIQKEDMQALCRLTSLTSLKLPNLQAPFNFPLPSELSNLSQLKHLSIAPMFHSCLLDFSTLSNLIYLSLSFGSVSWDDFIFIRDSIGRLQFLRHLSLSISRTQSKNQEDMYTPVTSGFEALETLTYHLNPNIYLSPFLFIANPKKLKALELRIRDTDPSFQDRLLECSSLTSLSLTHFGRKSGLEFPSYIKHLSSLSSLSIAHKWNEWVTASFSRPGDAPACVIPPIWDSLPNLRHLSLYGDDFELPDDSFSNLCSSLSLLESLSLTFYRIYSIPKDFGLLSNLSHLSLPKLPSIVYPDTITSCHSLSLVPFKGKQFFYDNVSSFPFLDNTLSIHSNLLRVGINRGETPRDAMRRSLPTYRLHFKEWKDRVMYEMENDIDPDQLPGAPHPFVPEEFLEFSWELDGRRFLFTALESGDTSVVLYCLKHCPLKYLDLNDLLRTVLQKTFVALKDTYKPWTEFD